MTELLSQFGWRNPWWLLLLLIPILTWMRYKYTSQNTSRLPQRLKTFAEPHLWRWLVINPNRSHRFNYTWPIILAWLLAAIAASGPYLKQITSELDEQRGIDIAVIVDISPSMMAEDVAPNRLARAKLELQDFIAMLEADRTALLAYSANAYQLLPLTHDRQALEYFIDALDTSLTRMRGSNLTQALELAGQLLESSQQQSRAIVLISDGGHQDHTSALLTSRRLQIPILILGVGTETGSPILDSNGQLLHYQNELVISRLLKNDLMAIANTSNGQYTDLKNDSSDWRQLMTRLNTIERQNPYQTATTPQSYQLFPWLLSISLLLFLWSGTRRFDLAVLVLALPILFLPQSSQASPWQEQKAYKAFSNKDWQQAMTEYKNSNTYNGQMGLGAAAYRLGNWEQAIDSYNQVAILARNNEEQAKAAFNIGNASARSGDLEKASDYFEQALSLQTNYPKAALNLSLVNQERKRLSLNRIKAESPVNNSENKPEQSHTADRLNSELGNARQEDNSQTKSERLQHALSQWQLGDLDIDDELALAMRQARGRHEEIHEFLRFRIAEQDAQHVFVIEDRPW